MSGPAVSFTDVYSSALRGEECAVLGLAGTPWPLPVSTWSRPATGGDRAVLAHCQGPTLDIGCGPGRMTQGLAELGHLALGIDLVGEAVAQTRARGVAALRRDVFAAVPGEGRWATALLADGNIGIGGDPRALLTRVADLIEPGGRVVVDLSPPGVGLVTRTVRLRAGETYCRPFRWSLLGVDAVGLVAGSSGLRVHSIHCHDEHQHDERWFAVLTKGAGDDH